MSWFKDHLVSVHCGDKERDKEDVVQIEKVPKVVRPVHRVEAAEDQEQVDEKVMQLGSKMVKLVGRVQLKKKYYVSSLKNDIETAKTFQQRVKIRKNYSTANVIH